MNKNKLVGFSVNATPQKQTKDKTVSGTITQNSVTPNITQLLDNAIHETRKSLNKAFVQDGYFNNAALGLGLSDTNLNAAEFDMNMITYNRNLITSTYHSSWIFRRAIDKVSQDMWSSGVTINTESEPDALKRIYKTLSRLGPELIWATQQARLFGGAAALIMVDDGSKDLTTPLQLSKIKKGTPIKLFAVDRWYNLAPSNEKVTNYKHSDFNTPKFYDFIIEDGSGSAKLTAHHTRVLRFVNRKSTKLINQRLMGWGISELEHIYQDLMIHENAKASSGSLVSKALLEIVKLDGIRSIIAGLALGNTGGQQQLSALLTSLNSFRTNNIVLMDKEDEYSQFAGQFSGLADLLESQKDLIAGAVEMPKVLLYGDTKGGLTSDSPAEMEFYAGTILGKQQEMLVPILDKLLPVIFKCQGVELPDNLDYEFENISGMSQEKQLSLLSQTIEAVTTLADNGMLTKATALKEVQQISKQTGFGTNISDEDAALAEEQDKQTEDMSEGDETIFETEDQINEYTTVANDIAGRRSFKDIFKKRRK